jgi:hypothetical protein
MQRYLEKLRQNQFPPRYWPRDNSTSQQEQLPGSSGFRKGGV